ncbi:MAG TPA: Rieske 2Fe-2S domain-containing protein [Pyrinomonadaceae bacterium]|jgi:Rieske Fe-S protein|nr:Rieske 2Fe-2S domain-containing protein [Pyrinomonadaceae bacterium]
MLRKRDASLSRREFCNQALLTSAAVIITATEAASREDRAQTLLAYPPVKIDGAERVMPGSFLYFDYPKASNPAVLVRRMDGEYLAYSRKCAHLGCSVDYDPKQRCLICPCHRGVYDPRTGYVMYGPPPRPLDQIILQMRAGGEVWAVGKRTAGDLNA